MVPAIPNEILSLILEHLAGQSCCGVDTARFSEPLAQYAAVSRRWQAHIEPYTFAVLSLTPSRVADGTRRGIVLSPDRLHYLRRIEYDIDVEPYLGPPPTLLSSSPREEEQKHKALLQERNNKAFSEGLRSLFAFLKPFDVGPGHSSGDISLLLNAVVAPEFKHAIQHTMVGTALQLDRDVDLPQLDLFTNFAYRDDNTPVLAPAALSRLLSRMPRATSSDLVFRDGVQVQDADAAFIHPSPSSPPSLPASVSSLTAIHRLWFNYAHFHILRPGTADPLSLAYHALSQRLTNLRVRRTGTVLTPDLLWPQQSQSTERQKQQENEEEQQQQPYWPHLRTLHLSFPAFAPQDGSAMRPAPAAPSAPKAQQQNAVDGRGPSGPADNDEFAQLQHDGGRAAPLSKAVVPYVRALLRAAPRMPALDLAAVAWTVPQMGEEREFAGLRFEKRTKMAAAAAGWRHGRGDDDDDDVGSLAVRVCAESGYVADEVAGVLRQALVGTGMEKGEVGVRVEEEGGRKGEIVSWTAYRALAC